LDLLVEKLEVKSSFVSFELVENTLGNFYYGEVTHQACDFNKFLWYFREITKPTGKASKKLH